MASRIDVTLNGIDNLSSVLRGASMAGTVMGNAISGAMGLVGNAVSGAVGKMQSLVSSASDAQTDMISFSGSMQAMLGGSFGDATLYADKLNAKFVQMGATLPGVTSDYATIARTIGDDVGNALKGLDGSLNKDAFESKLLEMSRGVGILSQAAKTSASEAAFAIQRVMNGDKNAFKLLFFDKNPVIKGQVEKFLASEGKTLENWTEMTTKDRIDILNKALGKAASPEMIAALSKTAAGKYAEWETTLFDPTTGLLGFMRKVESRGQQTAMDAIYKLMDSTENAFTSIAALFPFKVDVMAGIIDALTSVSGMMDTVANGFKGLDLNNLQNSLSSGINGMFVALQGFDFSPLGHTIGKTISGMLTTGVDIAVGMLGGTNFEGVLAGLSVIGNNLVTGFDAMVRALQSGIGARLADVSGTVMTMLATMDWTSVIAGLGEVSTRMVTGLYSLTQSLAGALGEGVSTMANAVTQAATGADWTSIGVSASNAFASAITGVIGTVVKFIASTDWGAVYNAVTALRDGLLEAFRAAIINLGTALASAVANGIGSLASAVAGYLQNAFAQAMSSVSAAPAPATPTAPATPAPTTTPTTPGTANASLPAATPSGGTPSASAETAALQAAAAGRTAATGNLAPLFAAVSDEQRVSGGKAIIANSRETILNPTQTNALAKVMGSFSPTINVTGGGNSQDIALAVTNALDQLYRQYQLSM